MTYFVILASIRAFIFVGLLSFMTSSLMPSRPRRLAIFGLVSLLVAAGLDGTSARGWSYEYLFGHPFFFYLFLNAPIVLVVLALFIVFPGSEE